MNSEKTSRPPCFLEKTGVWRDCTQVLIQLAAVKSAINNTGKLILKDHLNHCMVEAAKSGDRKAFDDLNEAIDRFLK